MDNREAKLLARIAELEAENELHMGVVVKLGKDVLSLQVMVKRLDVVISPKAGLTIGKLQAEVAQLRSTYNGVYDKAVEDRTRLGNEVLDLQAEVKDLLKQVERLPERIYQVILGSHVNGKDAEYLVKHIKKRLAGTGRA